MHRGVVLCVVFLAGCGGPYAADLEAPGLQKTPAENARWVFEAGSDALLEADAPVEARFRLTGYAGAEPNIGVTSSGNVFLSAYDDVVRRVDDRRWERVYTFDPALGQGGTDTGDPMLWVDPVTDRIYSSHMFPSLVCFALAWSEDEGQTWDENDATCSSPGVDHQKFFSAVPGPAAPPMAGQDHPTVLYQCYQRLVATEETGILVSGYITSCNLSYDGGMTWPYETVSAARLPAQCGGINGHPAAAPDGTVVVPITRGCDGLYVSVSLDSGLTWTNRPGPTSVGAESIDPDLAFTPDGTLYAIWRGSDHLTYLARSDDVGLTWDGPWRVSPPHVTSTVFQAISAGDDGRIAMAFLGTSDTSGESSQAPDDTRWHLYIASADAAGSGVPVVDVVQVTREGDPVQLGCVWLNGGGHPCRNMLDFIDSAVGPAGEFYVAFTKGCMACERADDKSSVAAVAWVEGLRLRSLHAQR